MWILKDNTKIKITMMVWHYQEWMSFNDVDLLIEYDDFWSDDDEAFHKDSTLDEVKNYLEDWKNYETDADIELKEYIENDDGDWEDYKKEHERYYEIEIVEKS